MVLGWELLLPQGGHRDTRGPFPPTSLDTQPLSQALLRSQDRWSADPELSSREDRWGQFQRGDAAARCPVWKQLPAPPQMELAVSHMETQPHSGLPMGAAGVCGSSFDPQQLPREGHLPSSSTQHPLAWNSFPCSGSCTNVANILTLVH